MSSVNVTLGEDVIITDALMSRLKHFFEWCLNVVTTLQPGQNETLEFEQSGKDSIRVDVTFFRDTSIEGTFKKSLENIVSNFIPYLFS